VQPRLPAPPLRIIDGDGRKLPLSVAIAGKVTAVQLMFTGCSSTCPIQGALFADVAARVRSKDVQLLSISIDALGDTAATLSAWQARFGRHSAWNTAVADVADVDRLVDFMKGATGKSGTHTAQVFVFDRQTRLCYRTGDSPAVGELEALLARVTQSS
jgi:protein SCO1/2